MNILNKILLIRLKQLLLIIFLFPISISAEDLKLFDRFYLGGGTGVAGNELEALGDRGNNFALLDFELIDRRRNSGMLSYIQLGKDWQFDNNFVAGIVLDYHWFKSSEYGFDCCADAIGIEAEDSFSIRTKLGYLVSERLLAYGTLGIGSADAKVTSFNNNNTEIGSADFDGERLVIGAGLNWYTPYSDNWSLVLEGLYYPTGPKQFLEEDQLTSDQDIGDYGQINSTYLVKIGINYSFGEAASLRSSNLNQKIFNTNLFNRYYMGGGLGIANTEFDAHTDIGVNTSEIIDRKSDTDFFSSYFQAGKDWQFNNNLVFGIVFDYQEIDNQVDDIDNETDPTPFDRPIIGSEKMMSLRTKLGHLLSERMLVYGTIGLANYRAKIFRIDNGDPTDTGQAKMGFTNLILGAGTEWYTPYSDNFSVHLEGLYFPSREKTVLEQSELDFNSDEGDYGQVNHTYLLRLGINYSF